MSAIRAWKTLLALLFVLTLAFPARENFAEALEQWEAATRLAPEGADSLAGKAIALDAIGKHAEALEAYRAAVSHDARFLDLAILKKQYLWSESACNVARPLIDELSRSAQNDRADSTLS